MVRQRWIRALVMPVLVLPLSGCLFALPMLAGVGSAVSGIGAVAAGAAASGAVVAGAGSAAASSTGTAAAAGKAGSSAAAKSAGARSGTTGGGQQAAGKAAPSGPRLQKASASSGQASQSFGPFQQSAGPGSASQSGPGFQQSAGPHGASQSFGPYQQSAGPGYAQQSGPGYRQSVGMPPAPDPLVAGVVIGSVAAANSGRERAVSSCSVRCEGQRQSIGCVAGETPRCQCETRPYAMCVAAEDRQQGSQRAGR